MFTHEFDLNTSNVVGNPPRSRKAGRGVRNALRGDFGPWRHQRGARVHWADQRHLRLSAVRRHHNPGRLGGRQERVCAQCGSLVGGGDQERPPLSLLICEEFWKIGLKVLRGVKDSEGCERLTDWGVGPLTETVCNPLFFLQTGSGMGCLRDENAGRRWIRTPWRWAERVVPMSVLEGKDYRFLFEGSHDCLNLVLGLFPENPPRKSYKGLRKKIHVGSLSKYDSFHLSFSHHLFLHLFSL